jgi:hypothetical protein
MNPEDVHKLAGALVLTNTLLLLGQQAGLLRGAWARFVLPGFVISLGLFLVLDPIVFHGGGFGAEGLQHQIQGLVALGIGIVEAQRARGRLQTTPFALALPVGITAVGLLFVLHSQHGSGNMALQLVQHRILGATVVLAGIVKGIDSLKLAKGHWAAVGWLLLLLVVSLDLFLYVEGNGSPAPATNGSPAPLDGGGGHGGH